MVVEALGWIVAAVFAALYLVVRFKLQDQPYEVRLLEAKLDVLRQSSQERIDTQGRINGELLGTIAQRHAAETERWKTALQEVREQHLAEIGRMTTSHHEEIERLTRLFDRPTVNAPKFALEVNTEPDAETRLLQAAHDSSVEEGMRQLTEEYRERGLSYTEEEVREHVESMIRGEIPV